MTSASRAALTLLVLGAALSFGGVAHAGGADADRETARGLLEEGKARRDRNDWPGALQAFKAADVLMHVPTTGLFVAKAHLALGQLVEAREAAIRVTHLPVEPKESKPFTEARATASTMSDELAPRIPTLHLVLKGGEHTTPVVKVDDVPVPLEALVLPRKLNPGHHVIVVAVEQAQTREEIDLVEHDAKEVTVDVAALEAANARAKPVAIAPPPPPPEEEKKSKRSPLVYAGFGAAVVGVAVGTVAGVITLSKRSTIDAECRDSKCPPSAYGDLDSAQTTATISTVGFVVAGVGAVVGVVGLVMGKSAPPPATTATTAVFRPRIFMTANGIGGSF